MPAIEELGEDEYVAVWARFKEQFRFRSGMASSTWPAIAEPATARTWSVANLPDGDGYTELDEMVDVVQDGLCAVTPPDGTILILDWHHTSYRIRPHRIRPADGLRWPLGVMPDGDYIVNLAEDFSYGTFGHPWEETLCVFGTAVVERVAERLDAILGPPLRIGGRKARGSA